MTLTRRGFLGGLAASAGAALVLRWSPSGADVVQQAMAFAPNPFIAVFADGRVRITNHRSEMGPGVRSSLPVLIADELGAKLETI